MEDHQLDLLRQYVDVAYTKVRTGFVIPPHSCPIINEVIAAVRESTDPNMVELEDKLEEIRQINLELRLAGKRFKKLANSFRYRVKKYHDLRTQQDD